MKDYRWDDFRKWSSTFLLGVALVLSLGAGYRVWDLSQSIIQLQEENMLLQRNIAVRAELNRAYSLNAQLHERMAYAQGEVLGNILKRLRLGEHIPIAAKFMMAQREWKQERVLTGVGGARR